MKSFVVTELVFLFLLFMLILDGGALCEALQQILQTQGFSFYHYVLCVLENVDYCEQKLWLEYAIIGMV